MCGYIHAHIVNRNICLLLSCSYGFSNCDQQLQGIQSGRKTLTEVMADQERLIAEIAEQYRVQMTNNDERNVQGVQDLDYVPHVNVPCPQGVQGKHSVLILMSLSLLFRKSIIFLSLLHDMFIFWLLLLVLISIVLLRNDHFTFAFGET